jgi:hypothetical protein
MQAFIEDLKSRVIFENLATMVSSCTQKCVENFDEMYLNSNEEVCVKNCFLKNFEFQTNLNAELPMLIRNLWSLLCL